MKSRHTSVERKNLESAKWRTNATKWLAQRIEYLEDNPENWPTLDELPQTDASDLVEAGQYQSTIDADFES